MYRILGATTTKIVVWAAVAVAAVAAVPFVMERIELIAVIYNRQTFDWQLLWTAIGSLVLTTILAAISFMLFGLMWGIAIRVGGWALYRREIREIKSDISAIKKYLGIDDEQDES